MANNGFELPKELMPDLPAGAAAPTGQLGEPLLIDKEAQEVLKQAEAESAAARTARRKGQKDEPHGRENNSPKYLNIKSEPLLPPPLAPNQPFEMPITQLPGYKAFGSFSKWAAQPRDGSVKILPKDGVAIVIPTALSNEYLAHVNVTRSPVTHHEIADPRHTHLVGTSATTSAATNHPSIPEPAAKPLPKTTHAQPAVAPQSKPLTNLDHAKEIMDKLVASKKVSDKDLATAMKSAATFIDHSGIQVKGKETAGKIDGKKLAGDISKEIEALQKAMASKDKKGIVAHSAALSHEMFAGIDSATKSEQARASKQKVREL